MCADQKYPQVVCAETPVVVGTGFARVPVRAAAPTWPRIRWRQPRHAGWIQMGRPIALRPVKYAWRNCGSPSCFTVAASTEAHFATQRNSHGRKIPGIQSRACAVILGLGFPHGLLGFELDLVSSRNTGRPTTPCPRRFTPGTERSLRGSRSKRARSAF